MRKLALFLSLILFIGLETMTAQTKDITGKVVDDLGVAIPGVSIVVKGTTIGTVSRPDGTYVLSVSVDATNLVFTFVGMKSQDVLIAGQSIINATMQPDTEDIDEVVVLGYVTRNKNELTGSSVKVSGSDIQSVPVPSIDQALQGKVAGVTISAPSGTPGSVQNIRIRGISSVNSNNEPLYVVDGIPINNIDISGKFDELKNERGSSSTLSSLASLNSNNIESITVLKDASATSQWGAAGSNGVIIITTKMGKEGKTNFNFKATYGWANDAVEGYDVLTAPEWDELYKEIEGTSEWDGTTNTDWGELVKNKDATQQSYDFSASGGSKGSSFFASVGYSKNEGTSLGSDFERYTGQLNISKDLSKKFKFSSNNSASNMIQNGVLENSAYFSNPVLTKYFMPSYLSAYNEDGTLNLFEDGETSMHNTLYTIENDMHRNDVARIMSNNTVSWDILKNLTFKSTYAIDYLLADYKDYSNPVHGDGDSTDGSIYQKDKKVFNWIFRQSIGYKKVIDDHKFDVLFVHEYQKNKNNILDVEGEKFPIEGMKEVSVAGNITGASGYYDDWAKESYLAIVNYGFANRYYLDASLRTEASSKFSADERWGSFWSVGGAWNINREAFLENISFIDQLRLRASYGMNGNDGIQISQYQSLIAYDENYNGSSAGYPLTYGVDELSWERNEILDVAVEFGLFDKVSGSIGYYNRKTSDLLFEVPLSDTQGFENQVMNVGNMTNKGLEFGLNITPIQTNNFSWDIGFNFATVDNNVDKLAKDTEGNDINIETSTRKVEVGKPVYGWNMKKYAGVDSETGNPLWYINGKDGETTNDYSSAEKAYQGASALPTYSGSINTNLNYKGISLSASVYFAGGHKVYEDWAFYTHHPYYSILYYQGVDELMDRWQNPGDVTDVPRVGTDAELANASESSTRFLYDGDYMRLKDITLGYLLPENLVSKVGLASVKAYIRGTNLLTWVKDDRLKYDPEVQATGFTRLSTPPSKSVVIGVNINF